MNIRKTLAVIFLGAVGLSAALVFGSASRMKNLIDRLAENERLSVAGIKIELGPGYIGKAGGAEGWINRKMSSADQDPELVLPPFPVGETAADSIKEAEKKIESELPIILPTTIGGGMVISNDTSYELDLGSLVSAGTPVKLSPEGPQILIIHTHGSEAYTSDGTDTYPSSDDFRTEDVKYNVVRIGDELTSCLESYGLSVVHDRNIYDSPSYTGSYARSGGAAGKYLEMYPGITVIFDVHRDAIGNGDAVYKTVAEANGKPCSQVMLLAGTGENGLEHPQWQENLKFALFLQSAVIEKYPSLARPIALKKERYNQQLSTGCLILEVGSSGNTLNEALNAVRLFADAAAQALLESSEGGEKRIP